MNGLVAKYGSFQELNSTLSAQIKDLENQINNYSKLIGGKLRSNKEISQDDPDLLEIKENLEGTTDPKKKKKPSKKKTVSQWFDLDGLYVYNGNTTKGELELYFKAVEGLKAKLENIRKTKNSLDSIVEKGLKTNLGCIVLQNSDSKTELVFTTNKSQAKKFSFKSIINVKVEPSEIMIKS